MFPQDILKLFFFLTETHQYGILTSPIFMYVYVAMFSKNQDTGGPFKEILSGMFPIIESDTV